mmetsp:Transcript_28413/g.45491  ORF Transcript_28413/g.45491 Transcript_28413/m.45491 type:complete len:205 (-) Transcript_28413:154-768(-)
MSLRTCGARVGRTKRASGQSLGGGRRCLGIWWRATKASAVETEIRQRDCSTASSSIPTGKTTTIYATSMPCFRKSCDPAAFTLTSTAWRPTTFSFTPCTAGLRPQSWRAWGSTPPSRCAPSTPRIPRYGTESNGGTGGDRNTSCPRARWRAAAAAAAVWRKLRRRQVRRAAGIRVEGGRGRSRAYGQGGGPVVQRHGVVILLSA